MKDLKCCKCKSDIKMLEEDGRSEYLIQIIDKEGKVKYICKGCFYTNN